MDINDRFAKIHEEKLKLVNDDLEKKLRAKRVKTRTASIDFLGNSRRTRWAGRRTNLAKAKHIFKKPRFQIKKRNPLDVDRNGKISNNEVAKAYLEFKSVFGQKPTKENFHLIKKYDFNGDGGVGIADFGKLHSFMKANPLAKEIVKTINKLDLNNDNKIDQKEAAVALMEFKQAFGQTNKTELGAKYDLNGDGGVSIFDAPILHAALSQVPNLKNVVNAMNTLDSDSNGLISNEEAALALMEFKQAFGETNETELGDKYDFNGDGGTSVFDVGYMNLFLEQNGNIDSLVNSVNAIDRNNDGLVSNEEAAATLVLFRREFGTTNGNLDVNNDGGTSIYDLPYLNSVLSQNENLGAISHAVNAVDENKDGVVSHEEMQKAYEDFKASFGSTENLAHDHNGDGGVSIFDLAALNAVNSQVEEANRAELARQPIDQHKRNLLGLEKIVRKKF